LLDFLPIVLLSTIVSSILLLSIDAQQSFNRKNGQRLLKDTISSFFWNLSSFKLFPRVPYACQASPFSQEPSSAATAQTTTRCLHRLPHLQSDHMLVIPPMSVHPSSKRSNRSLVSLLPATQRYMAHIFSSTHWSGRMWHLGQRYCQSTSFFQDE